MKGFDPAANTEVCVYGPPEYFSSIAEETNTEPAEELSFFEKIIELFKKLIEFIKGLFN